MMDKLPVYLTHVYNVTQDTFHLIILNFVFYCKTFLIVIYMIHLVVHQYVLLVIVDTI